MRDEVHERKESLLFVGKQTQQSSPPGRLSVGENQIGRSRENYKRQLTDEIYGSRDAMYRDLVHKRQSRERELSLRKEELYLSI